MPAAEAFLPFPPSNHPAEAKQLAGLLYTACVRLIQTGLVLGYFAMVPQIQLKRLGWDLAHLADDLKLVMKFAIPCGGSYLILLAGARLLLGERLNGLLPSPVSSTGGGLLLFFTIQAGIGPLAEELVFRGCMQQAIRKFLNAPLGIGAASLFFAAIHYPGGGWEQAGQALLGGLIFGTAFECRGRLLAPVLLHMGANATLLLTPLLL
jgi:membrane protease YdiL (CAAX protease family)